MRGRAGRDVEGGAGRGGQSAAGRGERVEVLALLMDTPEKVATPATAAWVSVPERAPALGLVPMAMVIEAVLAVTRLPPASSTCTVKSGMAMRPW